MMAIGSACGECLLEANAFWLSLSRSDRLQITRFGCSRPHRVAGHRGGSWPKLQAPKGPQSHDRRLDAAPAAAAGPTARTRHGGGGGGPGALPPHPKPCRSLVCSQRPCVLLCN